MTKVIWARYAPPNDLGLGMTAARKLWWAERSRKSLATRRANAAQRDRITKLLEDIRAAIREEDQP